MCFCSSCGLARAVFAGLQGRRGSQTVSVLQSQLGKSCEGSGWPFPDLIDASPGATIATMTSSPSSLLHHPAASWTPEAAPWPGAAVTLPIMLEPTGLLHLVCLWSLPRDFTRTTEPLSSCQGVDEIFFPSYNRSNPCKSGTSPMHRLF